MDKGAGSTAPRGGARGWLREPEGGGVAGAVRWRDGVAKAELRSGRGGRGCRRREVERRGSSVRRSGVTGAASRATQGGTREWPRDGDGDERGGWRLNGDEMTG